MRGALLQGLGGTGPDGRYVPGKPQGRLRCWIDALSIPAIDWLLRGMFLFLGACLGYLTFLERLPHAAECGFPSDFSFFPAQQLSIAT